MSEPIIRRVRNDLFFVEWGNVLSGKFDRQLMFEDKIIEKCQERKWRTNDKCFISHRFKFFFAHF